MDHNLTDSFRMRIDLKPDFCSNAVAASLLDARSALRTAKRLQDEAKLFLITAMSDNFDRGTPARSASLFRNAKLRSFPPTRWIEMPPLCCEAHVLFHQPGQK